MIRLRWRHKGGVDEGGHIQPCECLPMLLRPIWIRNLVLLIVSSNKIFEYGAGFKDVELLAIGGRRVAVCDGGDTAVGVDLKEPWLLLLVLHEGDCLQFIWKAEFFQGNANLVPCTLLGFWTKVAASQAAGVFTIGGSGGVKND